MQDQDGVCSLPSASGQTPASSYGVEGMSQEFFVFLAAMTGEVCQLLRLTVLTTSRPWEADTRWCLSQGLLGAQGLSEERHSCSAAPGKISQALRTPCRSDRER